jgi:nucleoside-diphosphate-sugar epimerase
MASRGRVYLFGDGEFKLNPIHGADLAEVCVRAIARNEKEIGIGGPDILTQNEIAELALSAMDKSINVVHLPDWIRRLILSGSRLLTDEDFHGPIEFFLTLIARDNIAERYGARRLHDYFDETANRYMHGYNQSS